MENNYQYFDRDISWLSFNYRVLLEADDDRLPLYERINFISIYSSNLEEFYKIRVADLKGSISKGRENGVDVREKEQLLETINREVSRQFEERIRIYENKILPALRAQRIIFYQSTEVEEFHKNYIRNFFVEEVFPFLQPVPVYKDEVRSFLRDNRLYMAVRLYKKDCYPGDPLHIQYFVIKLPYSKVPRFIELPKQGEYHYLIFLEDLIRANLDVVFPGYEVESSHCIKISRDADILVEDISSADIVEQMKKKLKKRKIGAVCRFVYERQTPADFLHFLMGVYGISPEDLVEGDGHLNLEDLRSLPCPRKKLCRMEKPQPMPLTCLNDQGSIFEYVSRKDLLLYYPYHSFDHFTHWLYEAVHDPATKEIMITQYRVAENSAVINTLISAAQNGKKVTVFVELKARFDEEHNLATAELMQRSGIHIIYSIPGMKVHAKVALVLREGGSVADVPSFAYISTGNFNEATASVYADFGLFTSNPEIVGDLQRLFRYLQDRNGIPYFSRLLVPPFNLIDGFTALVRHEMDLAVSGGKGYILLKMNALQDQAMIDLLYKASESGVKIDLIVRGICCLIPDQPYSKNIRITRIVDSFLEHARVWYFGNGGDPKLFLGSPDFMKRNLYRRIEAITPVLDEDIKRTITDILHIQLQPGRKACWVDSRLQNVFKDNSGDNLVRVQYTIYEYLKQKSLVAGKEREDGSESHR